MAALPRSNAGQYQRRQDADREQGDRQQNQHPQAQLQARIHRAEQLHRTRYLTHAAHHGRHPHGATAADAFDRSVGDVAAAVGARDERHGGACSSERTGESNG